MTFGTLTLLGCGDVGPIHEPIDQYSTLIRPVLDQGDVRIAQCERLYTTRGVREPFGRPHSRAAPEMARIFKDCKFDVVSIASNHAMDWGSDALLDTIDLLRGYGIQTIGGGKNIVEARQPAIVERNGVRIAVLAYCSVLPHGCEAGPNKAGIAPLRARTSYEPQEWQAGFPPRVITELYEEDLADMVDDIKNARQTAHAVVVSVHWGIHFVPRMIADYQTIAAKAAIEAGADLVLGHHPHVPKAIAVHSGKVCFYSLSNFIMSAPERSAEKLGAFTKRYGVPIDPDYPRLPYGIDSKRSLVAKAKFTTRGIEEVSFIPVVIDKDLRPQALLCGDERFDDAVNFMEWVSEDFEHRFAVKDNEISVSGL